MRDFHGSSPAAYLGGTKQVVEIGVVVGGFQLPGPVVNVQSAVELLVSAQCRTRRVAGNERDPGQRQTVGPVEPHSSGSGALVSFYNRINREQMDILERLVLAGLGDEVLGVDGRRRR